MSTKELFGSSSSESSDLEEELGREAESLPEAQANHASGMHDCDDEVFDKEAFDKAWEEDMQKMEQAFQEHKAKAEERRRHPPRAIIVDGQEDDEFGNFVEYYYSKIRMRIGRAFGGRTEEELAALQIERLPCSAEEFYQEQPSLLVSHGWTPSLRTVVQGTRNTKKIKVAVEPITGPDDESRAQSTAMVPACPLALLRNYENTLVRHIFSYLPNAYAKHVTITIPADLVGNSGGWLMFFWRGRTERNDDFNPGFERRLVRDKSALTSSRNSAMGGFVAFSKVGQVQDLFPPPTGRNVNMMPFELGNMDSLPDELQCYYPLIDACPFFREEFGKVAYLTVHESTRVEAGETQRRPGLHIESPGVFADTENHDSIDHTNCSFTPAIEHHRWGRGRFLGPDRYEGGIYIASSVDDSTALWDALVDSSVPGIVDRLGGIDHLQPLLPETTATKLRSGELVWMTDRTPHAGLPQAKVRPRTFFRLVMPYVTHWYAAHSTPNPKVQIPDSVTVIEDCKFAAVGVKAGPKGR